ncbi:MAG: AmmeMemoRadiSam system protein B [Candidatus Omnitrophota bacterium]|nr:AmmeMemoRadiSam system protein B [Candidatus Omnitrophota bacterium]
MEQPDLRKPAYAGQFYPATAVGINRQIEGFIPKSVQKIDIVGCILPHAGYIYSGRVAVETAAQINIKERIILLGPSHTGIGAPFSIMTRGKWQTPLGEVEIDSQLAKRILEHCKLLEEDFSAHLSEHSLEVELPILQYFKKDFKIVPIVFMSGSLEALKEIGRAIGEVASNPPFKDSTMLVASSDMTHYEPEEDARRKDKIAIEAIVELDEDKLYQKVRQLDISMCGFAPALTLLSAAKLLGARKARLIKYETSAEVSGDRSSVVGYAGILLY